MDANRFSIQKLNNSNYSSWRFKVELLLVREDLWRCVKPGAPKEGEDQDAFDAADARARATIGLLVEDKQHTLIRSTETAKAAWEALQNHHQKTTLTSKVSLLKQICDRRLADGESMEDHLFVMEELFEKLRVAGQDLAENLRVAMILRSLPSSYDTLTTALESRSDAELTLELVKRKLLDEVAKRKGSASNDAVLKVSAVRGREKQKKTLICYQCGCEGHKIANCPQRTQSQESTRGAKPTGKSVQKKKEESVSFAFFAFAYGCDSSSAEKHWIVDSGASSHTVSDRSFFEKLDSSETKSVKLADGKLATVEGQGCGVIECCNESGQLRKMYISDALYTPDLTINLLSVPALVKKGAEVIFDSGGCRILRGEKTVAVAALSRGLYRLKQPEEVVLVAESHHNKDCKHVWHRRLGHRDPATIGRMQKENLVIGLKVYDCGIDEQCEICLQGKSARTPFPKESFSKTEAVMDLVHTDVCGPVEVPSVSGFRYFMTVIDDYSRYCVLYLLKKKSEVAAKIEEYVALVQNLFGRKPKIVRSDQGGEYSSDNLLAFYRREGIQVQFTAGYSPQQNGVAERKNRYLVEMCRCMLFDAGLPQRYWAEALNTAVYLQNILHTKAVLCSPYELWHGKKPEFKHLRIFGSTAWVYVPKEKRKKLTATSKPLIFVGYSTEHKAYRFLDRSTQKVIVSRDVRFIEGAGKSTKVVRQEERKPAKDPEITSSQEETVEYESVLQKIAPVQPHGEGQSNKQRDDEPEPIAEKDHEQDQDDESFRSATFEQTDFEGYSDNEILQGLDDTCELVGFPTEPVEYPAAVDDLPAEPPTEPSVESERATRKSDRATKGIPPNRYQKVNSVVDQSAPEPRTYKQAIDGPEKIAWQAAMEEEIRSLNESHTWELVQLPPGQKAVGCKWTYKKKEDEHGKVVRYRARLVAQGFTQRFGTDYDEVFAPVGKQTTLRMLLTIANRDDMVVKHIDIKCAYLNGELVETVFMKQPPGFQTDDGAVCKLKRSLYGLKQSARVWNTKIDGIFKGMGFLPGKADTCLYVKKKKEMLSYILLYVDDMVVFCHSESEYESISNVLQRHFTLSSLGELHQFLGIHIEKVHGHYTLNQKSYIDKIVGRFGQADAKTSRIPMDPGYLQQKEEVPLPTNTTYCSLVGSLLYVSVNTRPDICIGVSLLCQKVSNPTERDWTEAKRILKYLKGTKDHRLHLGSGSQRLECFVDADYAGNERTRKSNSGLIIKYGGGTVSWATRKQACTALSSTEAEFIALAEGCQELLWMRKLLNDLGEPSSDPIPVWEDNQSCIKMVKSDRIEKRSKHIDTKHTFSKDLLREGVIDLKYLPTEQMEADLMTKPLDRTKLERHRTEVGVKN